MVVGPSHPGAGKAAAQPTLDTGEYTWAPASLGETQLWCKVLPELLAPWPRRLPVMEEERPGHA